MHGDSPHEELVGSGGGAEHPAALFPDLSRGAVRRVFPQTMVCTSTNSLSIMQREIGLKEGSIRAAIQERLKSHMWKCTYHTGRALMNCIALLADDAASRSGGRVRAEESRSLAASSSIGKRSPRASLSSRPGREKNRQGAHPPEAPACSVTRCCCRRWEANFSPLSVSRFLLISAIRCCTHAALRSRSSGVCST